MRAAATFMSIGEVVSKREAPHSYAIHIRCKRMLITYGDPNAIDLALVLSLLPSSEPVVRGTEVT